MPTFLNAVSDEAEAVYVAARGRRPAGAIVALHVGEASTAVAQGQGGAVPALIRLALGAKRSAQAWFRSDVPTALELETAIAEVEDELMRAGVAPGSSGDSPWLVTADPHVRTLAGTETASLPLASVEMLFQRLASASLGHAGALAGMPPGREAAAVLLILREFMHHGGHGSITVLDGPPEAPAA